MSSATLPRWDTADLFPGLGSRELTDAIEGFGAELSRLEAEFDGLGIRGGGTPDPGGDGERLETALHGLNAVLRRAGPMRAYVYAAVTTNSTDEQAQALLGRISQLAARAVPLQARLAEWVAERGAAELSTTGDAAADHAGPLRQLAARAEHQMSEAEEHLYAETRVTGSTAWGRLHDDLSSQLSTTVELPGGPAPMGMAAVRGLASDPDPAVRRAAYDAEIAAWPTIGVAAAAAMNAIKGEANVVNRRRGWDGPLDASLFANSVSRPTFEAMQRAVTDGLPDFRRWMRAKARLHGHSDGLPWWDLAAPIPGADRRVGWDEGMASVRGSFASFSAPLAGLADRAVDERWIDAEPRHGKVGGAFCMPVDGDRSLVLLNWSGSLESITIAAHELGHAYHNVQLAERTPLQRMLPMALAETASIFCETLAFEDSVRSLGGSERLAVLDANLQAACMVLVDIRSRFLFESQVFDRRARRPLGVGELNELMLAAQAEAYGDGLDQATAHPYMWIVKPHYYSSHFYNWPYTYGLLFGLGLYSRYSADPERFHAGYDSMLSRAGMDTAEELAGSFGFDVTEQSFWADSVGVLRSRIDEYEWLAARP